MAHRKLLWTVCLTTLSVLILTVWLWQPKPRVITDQLLKLTQGMTEEQVAEILGRPLAHGIYFLETYDVYNPVFASPYETRYKLVAPGRADLPSYWIIQPGVRRNGLASPPTDCKNFYVGRELCVCAQFDEQRTLTQITVLPMIVEAGSVRAFLEHQYDKLVGYTPPPANAPLPYVPPPELPFDMSSQPLPSENVPRVVPERPR